MKRFLITFCILAAGTAIIIFCHPAPAPQTTDAALPVHTIVAAPQDLPFAYNTIGIVSPLQEVSVKPQISGKLVNILFQEGDFVSEGDIIAKIDDATPKAELDRTQAELAANQAKLTEAEANLQRYRKLHTSSIVSQKTLDEYEALYRQLKATVAGNRAQVKIAEISYNHTNITAPISGRIGLKHINRGNIVSTAEEIASIVQISPISVIFSIPQQLFSAVHHNSATTVEIADNASGTILSKGSISSMDNTIDPQSGTINIRANFNNEQENLYPGQSVAVKLIYGNNHTDIVLPANIVRPGLDGNFVFVAVDGKARITPVKIGYKDEDNIVIISGIKENDRIITDNFSKLDNGMPLKLLPESDHD